MDDIPKTEVVLKELKKIERDAGYLTPHTVLLKAEDKNSLLHQYFDWDNTTAGEQWRLWQARQLISSIRVEWTGRKVNAYHNVRVMTEKVPMEGYFPIEKIAKNEDLQEQVLRTAIAELDHWHRKYKEVKELADVVNEKKLEEIRKISSKK